MMAKALRSHGLRKLFEVKQNEQGACDITLIFMLPSYIFSFLPWHTENDEFANFYNSWSAENAEISVGAENTFRNVCYVYRIFCKVV